MDRIIAVVVTYNRVNCLKKVINALKGQTIKLHKIIVVNNGSTDGTSDFLMSEEEINVVNQANLGGSGGFWRGIKEALKFPCEWIWCMDDDVYPHENCLKSLLLANNKSVGILCPRRIQNNRIFYSEYKKLNLSNPFRKLHLLPLRGSVTSSEEPVKIEGMVFEGPLIKREVVDKIGLPEKELFIFYDDTDYSYRAILSGYDVLYVPFAIMDKEYFNKNLSKVEIINRQRWKTWYHIRNTAYFARKYGKNFVYRYFGTIGLPIHMFFAVLKNLLLNNKYEATDLFRIVTAYRDGIKGKLGIM